MALPCPFCGYDVRAQVGTGLPKACSRCPECGEQVAHVQIEDNLRLLCERRTPLLAFLLVPIDLLQLCVPRQQLARRTPLAPPRRALRVLAIGLPLWLFSAALLFLFIALLGGVTSVPGCPLDRLPPFTAKACQDVYFHLTVPKALTAAILFVTAFPVAAVVLMGSLALLRPVGPLGQVQYMRSHALRRAAYLAAPVFLLLLGCAAGTACQLQNESTWYLPIWVFPLSPTTCHFYFVWAVAPALVLRALRAGYADGREPGAFAYLGCTALAGLAWFVWFAGLGYVVAQENVGALLRLLFLWPPGG